MTDERAQREEARLLRQAQADAVRAALLVSIVAALLIAWAAVAALAP